jgi:hypothetical protein
MPADTIGGGIVQGVKTEPLCARASKGRGTIADVAF